MMSDLILAMFNDYWSIVPFFIVIAILLLFFGYMLKK